MAKREKLHGRRLFVWTGFSIASVAGILGASFAVIDLAGNGRTLFAWAEAVAAIGLASLLPH